MSSRRDGDVPRAAIERLRTSIAEERRRLHGAVRERIDDFDLEKVRKRAIAVARNESSSAVRATPKARRLARERARPRVPSASRAAIENAAGSLSCPIAFTTFASPSRSCGTRWSSIRVAVASSSQCRGDCAR